MSCAKVGAAILYVLGEASNPLFLPTAYCHCLHTAYCHCLLGAGP